MASPDLEAAARIYRRAVENGQPPLVAICRAFEISHSTAAGRIKRARQHGLLDPYTAACARVAADLGVTPQQLADAVIRHANGRLTVRRTP